VTENSRAARRVMIALGSFAFIWATVRAFNQSIVGDEATTYIFWVRPITAAHWLVSPNNHILNSLLMRWSVLLFGLTHFSVRAPALLGAALFIAAAFWFARRISADWKIQIPLFICLVYNPFVFDFYVAARGYGLALALLLWAIAIIARWQLDRGKPVLRAAAIASFLIGLSFTANFSFALAQAFCLLFLLIWTWRATNITRSKLIAAYSIPALLVILAIPSWTLLHWQSGLLFYGARSMREMTHSIIYSVFEQLNPLLVNPLLLHYAEKLRRFWLPVIGIIILAQSLAIYARRRTLKDFQSRWLIALAWIAAGTAAISLLIHWIAFHATGLLLPIYRTGLYLAPLATLLLGALAALAIGPWRRAMIALLTLLAAWFVLSLRLSSFIEWQYISQAKDAYYNAAWYARTHCIHDVSATWWYDAALDFYRLYDRNADITEFTHDGKAIPSADLFVLHGYADRDFIADQKLAIIYHGQTTDIVIAVRPSAACPQR
jgi:hypothetical protein